MPDDVVNICFSRDDIRNDLTDWAQRNRNASFFLPIAYVFVNDQYTPNNPIPQNWLYDIRPFFRTAELTLNERQSLAASVNPSVTNPVVTASYQEKRFEEEVDRTEGYSTLQAQVTAIKNDTKTVTTGRTVMLDTPYQFENSTITNGTVYNITTAILQQDRDKVITSVKILMRSSIINSDTGSGYVGVKTHSGNNLWIMGWHWDLRGETSLRPAPGYGETKPDTDGTQFTITGAQTGTQAAAVASIIGYTYEETISLGHSHLPN
mgnify:CR=1 FL=1